MFSRRWTNQTFWRRSRTENIHLDTGTSKSRIKSRRFSWRIRRVSSTISWLTSGCRWSDKWFLVHVRKLHLPPSRRTQSQTLFAERRIIIPCSTERCLPPGCALKNRTVRAGRSPKNTSGQARTPHRWLLEYRWIKRFVWFLDTFHSVYSIGRETSRRMYVVRVETDKKAANIQARLLMARNLNKIGKSKLDNARKLRGIYFVDPEDKEFKETVKNARKKLETPMAPRHSLQDMQDM